MQGILTFSQSNVAYLFANLIKSHKFAQCAYITCPGMQKKDTILSQCTVKMYLSPIPIPFPLLFVLTMTPIALQADGFICFSFESQSAKIILNCCSACYQMFNILYIRITLYNKESAKIILDCLRIKSIAQSSCYYCLLQLLILQILQIFLQLLVILLILLSLLILLLLLPPQH